MDKVVEVTKNGCVTIIGETGSLVTLACLLFFIFLFFSKEISTRIVTRTQSSAPTCAEFLPPPLLFTKFFGSVITLDIILHLGFIN